MEPKTMNIALCDLDALDMDKGAMGIELQHQGQVLSLFLVRVDERIYAYRNSCPHTGVELNWMPNQFLDLDRSFIQCATHDARFRIEDGVCIAGPCVGDSLEPLAVQIDNGTVYLRL
jgi:nitrite reductase/ring-hydroxylating ferredoxin subunit